MKSLNVPSCVTRVHSDYGTPIYERTPKRWVPKIGDHVKVTEGAGATSGRIGVIIPKKDIPTDHHGVPQINGGHYDRMKKDEYAIREDGTNLLFTMFRNYLQKVV